MVYTRFHDEWADLPATTTPVTADALEHIESGIVTASEDVAGAQQALANLGLAVADVRTMGAIGDGVTDDAAAIQSAIETIAAAGGGVLSFPQGTYRILSRLELRSNVTLRGDGAATIDISGIPSGFKWAVRAQGSVGSPVPLSTTAIRGEYQVSVSSADGFAVGDWVVVSTTGANYYPYGGSVEIDRGETKRIRSISGTTITFEQALYDAYSPANSGTVAPIDFVENVAVEGLRFVGSDLAAETQQGIALLYVNGFSIRNCVFDGIDYYCVRISASIRGDVTNNRMRGVYYDGSTGAIFYAVAILNSSQWIRVHGNHAEQVRHHTVTSSSSAGNGFWGYPRFITVTGNVAMNQEGGGTGRSWAFEHHGFGDAIVFAANVADGCYGGFVTRGPGVTFTDNIVRNWYQHGMEIHSETADARNILITNNQISNRSVEGGGATDPSPVRLQLGAATVARNIVVAGNVIEVDSAGFNTHAAIYATGTIARGLSIADNEITWVGAGASSSWVIQTDVPGVTIQGNRLTNCGYGIRVNGTRSIVTGNILQVSAQQDVGHGVYVNATNCTVTGNITDRHYRCVQSSASGTGLALLGNVGRSDADPFQAGTTTGLVAHGNLAPGTTTAINNA